MTIELRARPKCSGCDARVSSDAPGCDICGYLLLCDECVALHDHDEPPEEPIDDSCIAGADEPHRAEQEREIVKRWGFL